jgi:uncharacterized membrane protein YkvA (DUF1232 family)
MSLRITFDLSDSDLDHFRDVMKAAIAASTETDSQKITDTARALLDQVKESDAPEFIVDRLGSLDSLINMVHDEGWALPEEEQKRVLSALAYFSDPDDLIPDEIPGLGFLDDAIMIELVVRELRNEIDAYHDFCVYRTAEGTRQGKTAEELERGDWLAQRRKQLHARMRRRRSSRKRRGRSRRGRIVNANLFG